MIRRLAFKTIAPEDTIDLRHRVMWPDAPRSSVILVQDSSALHIGAFSEDSLIAVASFFPDGKSVRLRKLAVEIRYQGKGVASRLLDFATLQLQRQGYEEIWCDARVSALGFYRNNGFKPDDRIFQKSGLEYVVAKRSIHADAEDSP